MATYPYGADRKTEQKSRAESILNCGGAVKRASGGRVKTNGDTTISITVQPPAAADKPNPLAALAAMAPPPGGPPPGPGAGPGGPPPPMMPPQMGGPGPGAGGMRKGGRVGMKTGGRARKAFGGPMMDPAPIQIAPTPRPASVINPVVPNVPPAVQSAQQPLTQGFMARKTGGRIKAYYPDKGFGFIKPTGGGKDVFVSADELEKAGITAKVGKTVVFDSAPDRMGKGMKATNISNPQGGIGHKKAGGGVGSPGVTPHMTEGAGGGLGRLKKARDARAG